MTAIIISIHLILLGFCFYLFDRNFRVHKFRLSLIDKIFKSDDWRDLSEEFDAVGYCSMLLSFKLLRMECWFSEDFCEKINQVE